MDCKFLRHSQRCRVRHGGIVIAAVIAGAATIIAAVWASRRGTKRDLAVIHVLVNSRLSEALDKIGELEAKLIESDSKD